MDGWNLSLQRCRPSGAVKLFLEQLGLTRVVCVIVYEHLVRYLSSATSAHAHLERWDFNDHIKRRGRERVRELIRVY